MTPFQFIGLMKAIHGHCPPDPAAIQRMGLLAVKIGQHYALRVDFLDEAVCRQLAQLYRQTVPAPPEGVERLIDRNTPPGWRDHFAEFAPRPFASASIGQVHHARLKTGEDVVVKLVRGDFRAGFLRDIRSLRRFLRLCLLFYPKLRKVFNPINVLQSIEDYTLQELDLRDEIAGQVRLRTLADDYQGRYDLAPLRFHRLYPELSGENVLVAERVAGRTLDERLAAGDLPYQELLRLFNIHGFFMFVPGIYHGDIHPGNILLSADGAITFVDTGAISAATPRIQRGLFAFFDALTVYDYHRCADCLNAMAVRGIDGRRLDAFRTDLLSLYRDFRGKTVSEISLTRQMMNTIKLGVHAGMVFDNDMFPVIKSLMYMDGMVLRCHPRADLIADLRPFIDRLRPLHDEVVGKDPA